MTEPDVRCTGYSIVGGEISVGGDTVIEQEVIAYSCPRSHVNGSLVPRPRFPTAGGGKWCCNPPAAVGNLGLDTRLR